MKEVYLKYSILKIRQKISFFAFNKRETVIEFMINKILKAYRTLVRNGEIEALFSPE